VRGLAAAALALLALSPSALGEPIPSAPPQEVLAQIAAAQVPDSPAKVVVGAYINDIQELDFKTNSYAVDLYVCFRWKASDLDPSKTMEFMNRYDPNDHQRDELYDKPKQMPDGSLYAIIRNQGRFSTKFQLADYPFDTQFLTVAMEDTIASEDTQIYVPDPSNSLGLDPQITLPGFKVGKTRCGSCQTPTQRISETWRYLKETPIRVSSCPSRSPGRSWRCRSRPSFRSG